MKIRYFFFAARQLARLHGQAWGGLLSGWSLRRSMLCLVVLPLFSMLQLLHWFAFLFDELFFYSYRKVTVPAPVFVIGAPRSGTTFLQRVLALDEQFTSLTTWECLLAPSIIQRKTVLAAAALDRLLGNPVQRLFGSVFGGLQSRFDAIHAVGLGMPEEDYLTLLPLMSCFLLVLGFPKDDFLWKLGSFDHDLGKGEQRLILAYYHAMLQKHLYVHGRDKTMLSKNPAFCSVLPALRQSRHFADCRIICPMRDPVAAYRSQLSSIVPGLVFFSTDSMAPYYAERFRNLFVHYYEVLFNQQMVSKGTCFAMVNMVDLKERLEESLNTVYTQLGLVMSPVMQDKLAVEGQQARKYSSGHHYDLDRFDLDMTVVEKPFAGIVARSDFPCRRENKKNGETTQHDDKESSAEKLAFIKQVC